MIEIKDKGLFASAKAWHAAVKQGTSRAKTKKIQNFQAKVNKNQVYRFQMGEETKI